MSNSQDDRVGAQVRTSCDLSQGKPIGWGVVRRNTLCTVVEAFPNGATIEAERCHHCGIALRLEKVPGCYLTPVKGGK